MYFLFFRIFFTYATCYVYVCSSLLDDGVCAELNTISGNTIEINDKGCGYEDCDKEYVEENIETQIQINCSGTLESEGNYTIVLNEDVECYTRNYTVDDINRTLSDYLEIVWGSSCYDENGVESESICGLDGNLYCSPNISSAIFEEFWDICNSRDGKIDEKTKLLWDYYHDSFIEILTGPYCIDNVFSASRGPNLDYILDSKGLYVMLMSAGILLFLI